MTAAPEEIHRTSLYLLLGTVCGDVASAEGLSVRTPGQADGEVPVVCVG
jgi:hypothetical protein